MSLVSGEMEDLQSNFRSLFTFGKLIGLYPTSKFRIIGAIITVILAFNTVVDLVAVLNGRGRRKVPSQFFKEIGSCWFYLTGTLIYSYFYRRIPKLQNIFKAWLNLKSFRSDETLRRFVNLVSFIILTSAILENLVFHFKLFPVFGRSKEQLRIEGNISSLETYYRRSHAAWAYLIPYSPFQAILLIITNKLALYAWNFTDLFLICMCRAIQFQFTTLVQHSGSKRWYVLRSRCVELLEVLDLFEEFLSPLMFISYAINMYALCMQLNLWLTPSENTNYLHALYSVWSFIHLLTRILLVSIQAAKVNENALSLERKVQECPENEFSLEIERMEIFTKAMPAGFGLSGLGCFVITKKFILSMFSVAFTFEVFLLQADHADIN